MTTATAGASTAPVDLSAVKTRQQAMWASGDFAVIGTTLQIVGELLCEAVDVGGGERVLDVAAGNGNATLAAARRFARVTSTDYVPALLERRPPPRRGGRASTSPSRSPMPRRCPIRTRASTSSSRRSASCSRRTTRKSASELLRVCRLGGRIGLASWTPEGFIGQLLPRRRRSTCRHRRA